MASAGRILIIPKGNYNAETEYEMLDLVSNSGASWLAKKVVKGIEPSDANAEYWFKMCEGADLTELRQKIAAIENQLLSVANLDDIDLSDYATKAEVKEVSDAVDTLEINVGDLGETVNGLSEDVSGLSSTLAGVVANASQQTSKVAVVSYKGNGTINDANNPARVTFDFAPKVIVMLGYDSKALDTSTNTTYTTQNSVVGSTEKFKENVIFCDSLTTDYQNTITAGFVNESGNNTPNRRAKKSADGKTIYWYCYGTYPTEQFNYAGYTYYVLGIS